MDINSREVVIAGTKKDLVFVINLCKGNHVQVFEFAHKLSIQIRCIKVIISRAREELGFEPRYTIEEGIQKYAAWMKKVLK